MIEVSPESTSCFVNEEIYFKISGEVSSWDIEKMITFVEGKRDDVALNAKGDTLSFRTKVPGTYIMNVEYQNFKVILNVVVADKQEFGELHPELPEPGQNEYGVYPRQRILNENIRLLYEQVTGTNAKVNQLMTLIGLAASLAGLGLTINEILKRVKEIKFKGSSKHEVDGF